MKTRSTLAGIALSLIVVAVAFDAQPGWCQFKNLALGYSQCDVSIGYTTNKGIGPTGMVALPDGRIIVSSYAGGSYDFVPPNAKCQPAPPTFPHPLGVIQDYVIGMAVGLNGVVYGLDYHGYLVTVDPITGLVTVLTSLGKVGDRGLALDPLSGDLFTSNNTTVGGPQVWRISGLYTGTPTVSPFYTATGMTALDGLAWSCDGSYLLVAAVFDDYVLKINRSGAKTGTVSFPLGTSPDGIAFGAEGSALAGYFFVNSENGTVYQVSPTGGLVKIAWNGSRGDLLTVDQNGDLMLSQADRVTRLTYTPPFVSTTGNSPPGKWELTGSSLCSGLHCVSEAAVKSGCISGTDATTLTALAQSTCAVGTCGNCSVVAENLKALILKIEFIQGGLNDPTCLDPLLVAADTALNTPLCKSACGAVVAGGNGDFEQVQLISPYFSTKPSDIPGWTHTGAAGDGLLWAVGYTDSGGSVTTAGNGNQFVTLGGGFGVTRTASWSANITNLAPNTTYTLSFMLSREANFQIPSPVPITVSFSGGTSTSPQTFSAGLNTVHYWRRWEQESAAFTTDSTGSPVKVTFTVTNVTADLGLDAVTVTSPCH